MDVKTIVRLIHVAPVTSLRAKLVSQICTSLKANVEELLIILDPKEKCMLLMIKKLHRDV